VKELPLKRTREARAKRPRSGAWLRGRMASPNEAGFNLRESPPPSPVSPHGLRPWLAVSKHYGGRRTNLRHSRMWPGLSAGGRLRRIHLIYPSGVRDSAKSGMGWFGNRRLNGLAESSTMNVRGFPWNGGDNPPVKRGKRRRCHSSRRPGKPATGRRAPGGWHPRSRKVAGAW
jgi:hypothetical protein